MEDCELAPRLREKADSSASRVLATVALLKVHLRGFDCAAPLILRTAPHVACLVLHGLGRLHWTWVHQGTALTQQLVEPTCLMSVS